MRATEPAAAPFVLAGGPVDPETTFALAHALRTPLTSLALGLGLLDEGALGPMTEPQREVVRALVADVAKLTMLVERHLELPTLGAYAGPVERVRSDVGALVERALGPLVEQAGERGVTVAKTIAPGVFAVVDPVKLTWAVASLAGNAIRYSPRGGRVIASLAEQAGEAVIAIRDEGPGMSAEVARGIFDRAGGLGLFLVREIVEAHGGTIRVDSAPGQGSTFTTRLPAA
jgi:signal transduction histidine kinase